ncbi:Glu/Leu/Phe/Val dehydrogenase dimerization domain-containing protein [Lentzea sp. DG1S-22]|uniref:Glu/Leu/Phe/Val dehydrogenase dimerization domain-containing protein n=1 Tax=Lentzea sp. DG1S-22 TaxID=3108822 RepID=UPI002E772189|nr:Glu/Leu/Phe/Val dehydrogenase dimerization domain-containing protein [Lentzea sp. DG1S-22]WVH83627.1 Glu/Leu/Phe/Val dehydrogenase dimerization domain-containing protein [Lentzea sp. DG1S-22]
MTYLEVTWNDPATGARGYLVIDRLVRGVSSGGLRMRAGCTLDEVRGLAEGMTAKEALNYDPEARYVPLGGAKGGIDFDPYDARATEVLTAYLFAMSPYIERFWTMGEDLGLRQSTIDEAIGKIGLRSSIQAVYPLLDDEHEARQRLADAFGVTVDGVGLDELVGGYGVAQAALQGVQHLRIENPTAFVQGFGSMGGATARYLARAGVRVVGLADIHGVVSNPDGLDVETLLLSRDAHGGIDRAQLRPEDRELDGDRWLSVEADVLVPAATSYAIHEDNAHAVQAKLLVEAANMPVTAEAEARISALVIPDVVANSATNSWWWWTLFGDIEPTAESAFAKIGTTMRRLVARVLDDEASPREAARRIAAEAIEEVERRF